MGVFKLFRGYFCPHKMSRYYEDRIAVKDYKYY